MDRTDDELALRSKEGDLQAFNVIVERHQAMVYNAAARILGDLVAAEDVSQETFISSYRAIARFRGGSLRAWLLRIASNRSYDRIRSSKRRPEQSLDQSLLNPGFQPSATGGSPEQEAMRGELRVEIQRAIISLPADQRAALVLIDVQGLSYEEASQATGASLGTVKSRLSRARSRVRDLLQSRNALSSDQAGSR